MLLKDFYQQYPMAEQDYLYNHRFLITRYLIF